MSFLLYRIKSTYSNAKKKKEPPPKILYVCDSSIQVLNNFYWISIITFCVVYFELNNLHCFHLRQAFSIRLCLLRVLRWIIFWELEHVLKIYLWTGNRLIPFKDRRIYAEMLMPDVRLAHFACQQGLLSLNLVFIHILLHQEPWLGKTLI